LATPEIGNIGQIGLGGDVAGNNDVTISTCRRIENSMNINQ
jgi:hypothetical protein